MENQIRRKMATNDETCQDSHTSLCKSYCVTFVNELRKEHSKFALKYVMQKSVIMIWSSERVQISVPVSVIVMFHKDPAVIPDDLNNLWTHQLKGLIR